MKRLRLLLPLVILALGLGLAACGGGDDDGGGGEEDRIAEVIETSATSTDPADCKALATQAFLEQTEVTEGKEAVTICQRKARETKDDPDSVEVSEVEVKGSSATANAAFSGSIYDGQTLAIALVKEGGDWKLDEITGFAELDTDALGASMEEGLVEAKTFADETIACTGDTVSELSEAEAEEMMFGGSAGRLLELIEDCVPKQQ